MNRLNRYALSILALSVMIAIIAGVNATPTHAGPVVTGTVNIGNVPLPVTIAGDTTVSGTVKTQDVDNPARNAFQAQVCTIGFPSCDTFGQVSVPAGKRWVIEYVSGTCDIPSRDTLVEVSVATIADGHIASHVVPATLVVTVGTTKLYTFAQQTRLYADPGTTVDFNHGGAPDGDGGCLVSASGYLVAQ
jgi:hypothetical protein